MKKKDILEPIIMYSVIFIIVIGNIYVFYKSRNDYNELNKRGIDIFYIQTLTYHLSNKKNHVHIFYTTNLVLIIHLLDILCNFFPQEIFCKNLIIS